jgi:hypothetical protein
MQDRDIKLQLVYRKYVLGRDGIDAAVTEKIIEDLLSETMGAYSFDRWLKTEASNKFLAD